MVSYANDGEVDDVWWNIRPNWLLLVSKTRCSVPERFDLVPKITAYPLLWWFFCVVLCDSPYTVELSVWMVIACCGWTISSMVTIIDSPALELWNNAPTSASAAYVIIFFMMLEFVRIAPLYFLVSSKLWGPRENFSPTRLLACNSYRYDESLCMRNIINLELNLNLESGFVAQ